jgi:outer membrane protein
MTRTLSCLAMATVLGAAPARAQQPLEEFLRAAEDGGALELVEAEAAEQTSRSQVDEARARLLPSLGVTAAYTRNQFEAVVNVPMGATSVQAVITPFDQVEGRLALTVPVVDVAAWSSFFGAEDGAEASGQRLRESVLEVQVRVIQAYHALVEARAVADAARRALATSEESLAVVASRTEAGLGTELDRQRATADVERARQSVAEGELSEALAARQLFAASGLDASSQRVLLEDPLDSEAPLAGWMASAASMPAVRAAEAEARAADRARDGAWQALLPTLSASASERLTNATGFNGQASAWALGVTAGWTLDFARPAAIGTRDHQLAAARARLARVERAAETAIHEAWHRVVSLVVRARSARAAQVASQRAAEVARARFEAGTGTQLEVSQAERDVFAAEVVRIQADAALRVARLTLRVRAGRAPRLGGAS